jgi:regulator of protease activity HflC (stomatin/prohibitin superfamily)
MSIQRAATSLILGLLFVSLLVIYLVVPRNTLVTGISVAIMAISLVVALSGSEREIGVMAAFAALVSLVAAYFWGQARFGDVGGRVIPIIWGIFLIIIANWIQRNTFSVPRDVAIMIVNTYTGGARVATPPLAWPLFPQVERVVARIPLYELSEDVTVEKINTKSNHNIDRVVAHVRYQVIEPGQAMRGIPKRAQAQQEVAKALGQDINKVRGDITFWETLFGRQIQRDTANVVREMVWAYAPPPAVPDGPSPVMSPVHAYMHRDQIASMMLERLNELVRLWGAKVVLLELDHIDVAGERFKVANMEKTIERETRMSQIEAERQAKRIELTGKAEAITEAERVTQLVRSLQEAGVDLSPQMLQEIVVSAIRAQGEWEEIDYTQVHEAGRK